MSREDLVQTTRVSSYALLNFPILLYKLQAVTKSSGAMVEVTDTGGNLMVIEDAAEDVDVAEDVAEDVVVEEDVLSESVVKGWTTDPGPRWFNSEEIFPFN